LAEIFPLCYPTLVLTNQAIGKGCDAVIDLLKDRDPHVPTAASEAVANIFVTYWDVIPPNFV
jgi:hypothetical protein